MGWPLINIASLLGEEKIVKQLGANPVSLKKTDQEGNTALHQAASQGHFNIVKYLVKNGADINARNKQSRTALFNAAAQGKLKIVRYLLSKGADTSILTLSQQSPLSIAINNNHPATALTLAKQPAGAKQIHQAVLLAILKKMENVSLALIRKDKLLHFSYRNDRTALWHSADLGLFKTTQALIDSGLIDINQKGNMGYSPLARATYRGFANIFALLQKSKADLLTTTKEDNNLLMLAILSNHNDFIPTILAAGVDINAKNSAGDTALILAAFRGNMAAVKILIDANADLHIRNKNQLNAYESAKRANHPEVANYIREHSGKLFKLFN